MSAAEDRRQRARKAAKESHGDPDWFGLEASGPVNAAIEAATQVEITDEVIEAYHEMLISSLSASADLANIFRSAGFEVIE